MIATTTSCPSSLTKWREKRPALATPLREAGRLDPARQTECLVVLGLLDALDCDDQTLAAALWFEVEQCGTSHWLDLAESPPPALTRLVEGQQAAEKVWSLHAEHGGGSEGLRRLLLAIIRDLRVVFVLLARQLARMRAASALPAEEARQLASLTADIHAPLANRLGIWQLKWELEDLAFRYLQPQTYKRIARLVDERRADRERFIATCIGELRTALDAAGIRADLAGRPKHIFSIYRKMQRKGLDFSELYDIRAVRVLVDDVAACYAVLGVVHGRWMHIPGEFDDYIARPKGNHYRSLHTAVMGPEGKVLEVQIRTHAMHHESELGVAAHWRYKEGSGNDPGFGKRIAWMRELLEHRGDDDANLMADFRSELGEERVYLLTPRGEVMDLRAGATVLDFAYHVHTEVGHRCRGAKVNGRIVPLTFQPRSGDSVEILTSKVSDPSRDWLSPHQGYLHTARARDKVRSWFRRSAHEHNLTAGRAVLEHELKRLAVRDTDLESLPGRFGLKDQDALLEALALGEISTGQLARVLHEKEAPTPEVTQSASPVRSARAEAGAIRIEGVSDLMTSLARCCQPLPGDPVRGFITRARGVSVHRADCPSLMRLATRHPERVIDASWGRAPASAYAVDIRVRGYERKGLLKDATSVITNMSCPIVASSSRIFTRTAEVDMFYTLRVQDYGQLSALLDRLAALPNVIDARRVGD